MQAPGCGACPKNPAGSLSTVCMHAAISRPARHTAPRQSARLPRVCRLYTPPCHVAERGPRSAEARAGPLMRQARQAARQVLKVCRRYTPYSSHRVSNSSRIAALVALVECRSTIAPSWVRGISLSKAASREGCASCFQSTSARLPENGFVAQFLRPGKVFIAEFAFGRSIEKRQGRSCRFPGTARQDHSALF